MTAGQRLVLGLRRALKRVAVLVREAARPAVPAVGLVSDILRPRRMLLTENLLLRQQLLVLRRQVKRPTLKRTDRLVIIGASALPSTWRDSLLVVKPETVLSWHRLAFQVIWRWKSRKPQQPRVELEGLRQATPVEDAKSASHGEIVSFPVLGGLHRDYQRAA